VPLYCFKKNGTAINDFSNRKDILFIGGFGHTPNIDGVIWFCKEIWPLIKEQNNYINFIVAGSNPPDEILALSNESIQVRGFVTDEELEDLYNGIKLIVVPLRYGAGIKGKTVGSMYKGIPIVSTTIGIEGMDGNYSQFLKPFDDAQAFANEVISLYADEERQKKMSAQEVEYINKYFTISAAAEKMKAILDL
jgi:glycosyltransferase involved in cell wall biosynthesis